MKKTFNFIFKAGGFLLLAFSFSTFASAQQIKTLSGANSPQDDRNPVWIGDHTLLFIRAFHPLNKGGVNDPGDIWMSKRDREGVWSEAVHRPDLSTEGYDCPLGLEDALTLLVYHSDTSKHGIFQYSKFGSDWNFLRKINIPSLEELDGTITGRVVQGEGVLFLSAKNQNSLGNEDLYLSRKSTGIDWTEPKNLGPVINTPGQEMSPFYEPQLKLLFFSSNMQEGSQGKDIFVAKAENEELSSWSKPEKWQQISSPGSEESVTFINANEIVWTSTQNSEGFSDLLTFSETTRLEIPQRFTKVEQPEISQKGDSTDFESNEIVPIHSSTGKDVTEIKVQEEFPLNLVVIDQNSRDRVPFDLQLGFSGELLPALPPDETLFLSELMKEGVKEIRIASKGYFPSSISLDELKNDEPVVVLMTKAETGSSLILEKVVFKRGTAELEGEKTKDFLDDLAVFLTENHHIKIRINGHTDNIGDPGLNKALSLERAGAVRDYLLERGIEFERLRISGWGGSRPVVSNATEAGRAKNRRVELVVEQ